MVVVVLLMLIVLLILGLDTKSIERRVDVGEVIRGTRDMRPADSAVGVDSKGTAGLPAAAALGGPVPDALVGTKTIDGVESKRVEGMPRTREAKAPFGVDVAALVDDNVSLPRAADLRHPALGGLGGRVRDGDAVQVVLVLVRDCSEGLECLFGDLICHQRVDSAGGGGNATPTVKKEGRGAGAMTVQLTRAAAVAEEDDKGLAAVGQGYLSRGRRG